jgi:peptidoglycan/LPS O-acetylase OafA/YrhL
MLQTQTKKLDPLTTTRFLVALSVVFFHGGRNVGFLSMFPMLTSGPTAVGYFFLLSGFVMALAYHRPGTDFNFREYWLSRFSRIYPVYILAFALTCFYYLDLLSKIKSDKVWANVFLYQAWFPGYAESFNLAAWSLSVEFFFYLIFPFMVIWAMRRPAKQLIWMALGFWVLSQVVHLVLSIYFMGGQRELLAYFPPFHLNIFLLGMAGGIWYVTNSSHLAVRQSTNRILLILSLGTVFLALTLRQFMPGFPRYLSLDMGLLAPFFLIIVLTLALDTTVLSKILSHPTLVLLGDASYALYILHVPVRWLLERLLLTSGITLPYNVFFLAYVLGLILLCVFVFKFIEHPARAWLKANPHTLPLMFLDVVLILLMIQLAFMLRLGDGITGFIRTQTFALRVGLAFFFSLLLVFRFHTTTSWRSLGLAVLSGAILLAGFMHYAWTAGWVEGFPQSIVILIPLLIFGSIYLSRRLIHFFTAQFGQAVKTT